MIKHFLKLALTAATIFSLSAAPALAAPALTITIDSVAGTAVTPGMPSTVTINVPMLPWTVQVAGTGTLSNGALDGVSLQLDDNGTTFYGPTKYWQGVGSGTTHSYSVPWQIGSAGTHTITATGTRGATSDTDTVEVTVNTMTIIVNECPAAPAIAGDYMRSLTPPVKSGSSLWKTVINGVAAQTGSKGVLWAAYSCDNGYQAQVIQYIHDHYHI